MLIYGIDPSAETFTVGTFPDAGSQPANYDNTPEGVAMFIETLTDEDALVAVENTGVYSEVLCYTLHEAGISVVLLDPHAVHRTFSGTPKTDVLDSLKIAEYARRFLDRLAYWNPHEAVVEQVRVLLSTREQLVRQRTATVNARQTLRRKVIQTSAANEALEAVADQLKAQVKTLEEEVRRLIGEHPTMAQGVTLLMGIPGVGLLLGAQMLVLTAGFREPPQYRKLAQRLGIAPNAHQSGTSVRRRARSRGYGPPVVRKLLHLAARSVRTHNAHYRDYFEAKVAIGKPKSLVLNNIANRLLRIMCAVLRDGQSYQPHHISIQPLLLTSHRQSG